MLKLFRKLLVYQLSYALAMYPLYGVETNTAENNANALKDMYSKMKALGAEGNNLAIQLSQQPADIPNNSNLVNQVASENGDYIDQLVQQKTDTIAKEDEQTENSFNNLDKYLNDAKENSNSQTSDNDSEASLTKDNEPGIYEEWQKWREEIAASRIARLEKIDLAMNNFKAAITALELGEFNAQIEVLKDLTNNLISKKIDLADKTVTMSENYETSKEDYERKVKEMTTRFNEAFEAYFTNYWETNAKDAESITVNEKTYTKEEYKKKIYQQYYAQNWKNFEQKSYSSSASSLTFTLNFARGEVNDAIKSTREAEGLAYAAKNKIKDESNRKAAEAIQYAKQAKEVALQGIKDAIGNKKLIEDYVSSYGTIFRSDNIKSNKEYATTGTENLPTTTKECFPPTNMPGVAESMKDTYCAPPTNMPGVAEQQYKAYACSKGSAEECISAIPTDVKTDYSEANLKDLEAMVDELFKKAVSTQTANASNNDAATKANRKLYVLANTVCASLRLDCKAIGDTDSPAYHLFTAAAAIYLAIEVGQKEDYKNSLFTADSISKTESEEGLRYNEQVRSLERAIAVRELQVDIISRMQYSNNILSEMFSLTARQAALEIEARDARIVAANEQLAAANQTDKSSDNQAKIGAAIMFIGMAMVAFGDKKVKEGQTQNPPDGTKIAEGLSIMQIFGIVCSIAGIVMMLSSSNSNDSKKDKAAAEQEIQLAQKHGYLSCEVLQLKESESGVSSIFKNNYLDAIRSALSFTLIAAEPKETENKEATSATDPTVEEVVEGVGIVNDENNKDMVNRFYSSQEDIATVIGKAFETPIVRWRYITKSIALSDIGKNDDATLLREAKAQLKITQDLYKKLVGETGAEGTTAGNSLIPDATVYEIGVNIATTKNVATKTKKGTNNSTARNLRVTAQKGTSSIGTAFNNANTAALDNNTATGTVLPGSNTLSAVKAISGKKDLPLAKAEAATSPNNNEKVANIARSNNRRGALVNGRPARSDNELNANEATVVHTAPDVDMPSLKIAGNSQNLDTSYSELGGDLFNKNYLTKSEKEKKDPRGVRNISGKTTKKKTLDESTITTKRDVSIFRIISGRYMKTGYSHLGLE